MNAERIVCIVAEFPPAVFKKSLEVEGSRLFVTKQFLWFTAFVGLNLFQSDFTNICLLGRLLAKFGVNSRC